jgi:hypothetical protein
VRALPLLPDEKCGPGIGDIRNGPRRPRRNGHIFTPVLMSASAEHPQKRSATLDDEG